MRKELKKVAAAMLMLFLIFTVAPVMTPTNVYAAGDAKAIGEKFTQKIKAITEVLTKTVARAVFGLTLAGCLILGLFTQLPKKPLVIAAVSAVSLSAVGEIAEFVFPK